MDYDLNYVQNLTHLDTSKHQTLLSYFAKLSGQNRIEAHKLQTDLSRQHRNKYEKTKAPEFYHAMLLLALSKMKWVESSASLQTKKSVHNEELAKIEDVRIKRIKGNKQKKVSKIKRQIELQHFYRIQKFRNKNDANYLSWRQISYYIAKFHNQRISYNYLRKCYNEILADKKFRGEL